MTSENVPQPNPENPPPPGPSVPPRPNSLAGLSAEDLITLNEEIAGMARAGLPLDRGLAALAREMKRGRLQRVTASLAADLQSGHTLPEALERQGSQVPPFYAGLVAAGIRTGRITDVLATLTVYARTLANLRATVINALFYPAVVIVLAMVLFGFIFFGIVPQYEKIFADFKLKLPLVTEILFTISRHALELVVLPMLGIVGLLVLLKLGLNLSPQGRRVWARFVYAIPIVGTLLRSARLAAFTDLLGILVDHGLPLPEAFSLAGQASSDPMMAEAAGQVHADLSHGTPLGEVLRTQGLVPELVAWMTALGEQRGTLGPTLHQVAGLYRRQAEMRAVMLRTLLPPFLIIATAGVLLILFFWGITAPLLALLEGLSGATK